MAFRMSKMSVCLVITLFSVVSSGKIDLSIKKTWQKLRFLPPRTTRTILCKKPSSTMSVAAQNSYVCNVFHLHIYIYPELTS